MIVCHGKVIIACACGYRASGHQPVSVMETAIAHESFVHGLGMTADTHALLRETYADR